MLGPCGFINLKWGESLFRERKETKTLHARMLSMDSARDYFRYVCVCARFVSPLFWSSLSNEKGVLSGTFMEKESNPEFDKVQSRFFWQGESGKLKYHMVRWRDICMPKDQGGISITSTRRMNLCLMMKWIWRIIQGEGGLWLDLIKAKYLPGQSFFLCSQSRGSQFWQALQLLKPCFRLGASVTVGNGSDTLFWLDCWSGMSPLRARFPYLFTICNQPTATVVQAIFEGGRLLSFRWSFGPEETAEWDLLLGIIASTSLSDGRDGTSWRLDPSGKFTT